MKQFKTSLLALNFLAIWLAAMMAHGAITGITFTTLATFNNTNNGANPWDMPVLGPDGNLYGTTPVGGTNDVGVVFKITTNSIQTTLHTFSTNIWDGDYPVGQLMVGQDGNLYGVTTGGGTNNQGTIFEIKTNGTFTLLYSFGMVTNDLGYALDGTSPYGGLIQGRDGNFYGTTYAGGNTNVGTVFQFLTNGTLTTLYSFTGDGSNDDGAYPFTAPLVEGADGVFYGTTEEGGTNDEGTIFQITAGGTLTTLFEFGNANGSYPAAGLSFGTDGNLYGTTYEGGTNGDGTVFQITTNGNLTTLFQFNGTNGILPRGGVVVGLNNNLYGATFQGGTKGYGTVFQLATNGLLTTLYSFTAGNDGANPYAGVIRDASGNLYGTTYAAGKNNGYGTVYRLRDTANPTLSITAPTANQKWSNAVFTVTGTAKDNVGVANVFYSLNNSAWTDAINVNNWSNWTAQVTLTPGTNMLQAYAMDDSGNLSATSTVQFVYVLSAQLTVQTNGNGTVSPDYNNSLLQIGVNYSMTAKAATGFGFVNWTDGNGNVLTNNTTLKFLMASNLTFIANFVDTTKPTLSIVSPTTNQKWSNAVFTVTGTAKDNVGVANVFYSLNNSAWTNAINVNNWSNWTAQVTLTPGTNILQAYAVDGAGNISTTDTVKFVYILSAPLTVQTNGNGTVSPNYNGTLLQIGANYSMTATAAAGFGFTGWTGSITTNNATLKFLMASNLTFTANFVDVTKPTLSITSPTANQRWSNAVFTVTGTAKDNVGVANVFYSLNSAAWTNAINVNNWSNWTAQITLTPGTNTIQAYAVDGAGNTSTTNNVNFDFVVTNRLQVSATGLGTISPNYSNAWLEVGRNYSMTATPGKGFVVTNWTIATNQLTDGRVTNNATVQFTMVSNLILQVNFADVTKPTVTITSPTSGQHMTNALATFVGTASDNWGCNGVWYQLNNGTWSLATTANGYTNWTTTATLIAGTNTLKAYAIDLGGNFSATNSVSVLSSNTFKLQLDFAAAQPLTGNGLSFNLEISPGLSGHIQTSTNLLDWTTLTNFVGTNATLIFQDGTATNYDRKFYRAVIP